MNQNNPQNSGLFQQTGIAVNKELQKLISHKSYVVKFEKPIVSFNGTVTQYVANSVKSVQAVTQSQMGSAEAEAIYVNQLEKHIDIAEQSLRRATIDRGKHYAERNFATTQYKAKAGKKTIGFLYATTFRVVDDTRAEFVHFIMLKQEFDLFHKERKRMYSL